MNLSSFAKTLGIAAAAVGMVAVSSGSALAKYPDRPIQIIIPWGAGGGTDATGRMIGTVLQKELGVPVNVAKASSVIQRSPTQSPTAIPSVSSRWKSP